MKKKFDYRRLKYGTYSTAIIVVLLILLVVINLVVGEFDYKFDMTSENVFSLSDQTKQVLADTDKEINIYTLSSSQSTNTMLKVQQVLDQYRLHDRNIHIENKDIYQYPDFVSKYTANGDNSVDDSSIIVECGDKYRVISSSDYIETSSSYYSYDDNDTSYSLNVEEELTSAIQYVTSEVSSKVYFVTGHGEIPSENFESLCKNLRLNNYVTDDINLAESDIPEDCTILFVMPGTMGDYSADEAQKVKDYLAGGGRVIFLTQTIASNYPMGITEQYYPNLYSVLTSYGVKSAGEYVIEGDDSRYTGDPTYIMPKLQSHSITQKLTENKMSVSAYLAQPLQEVDANDMKRGLELSPLLATSEKSYIKGENATSINKESGDTEGSFALAYAVEDNYDSNAKLVVLGSIYLMLDENAGNTFVMEAFKWIDDSKDSVSTVSIASKSLDEKTISVTAAQKTQIQLLSWCIIPGILFLAGFIVWIIRRNG
jgi:hypothetical protein